MTRLFHIISLLAITLLGACTATMKTQPLAAVGYHRYDGTVRVETPKYMVEGFAPDSNAINGPTFIPLKISEPIVEYFGRRLNLELAAAGVQISDSAPYTLNAYILHLNEDCSFSACFSAEIRYTLNDSTTQKEVIERRYFGNHHPNGAGFHWTATEVAAATDLTLNQTIYDTIDRLLSDPDVQKLLTANK